MHRPPTRPRAFRLPRGLAALALASAAVAPTFAQDIAPPKDLPPPRRLAPPGTGLDLLASDGKPIAAGRIPEGTPKDARQLWLDLVGSVTLEGKTARTDAPRAFELSVDLRGRSESGNRNAKATFAFLDLGPGLVRGTIYSGKIDPKNAKSTQMRGLGPGDGLEYWFKKLDKKSSEWTKLAGRDYLESRNELDSWAAISYNIARLTRPNSFRLVELRERRTLPDAPQGVLRFEGDPGIGLPDTDITGVRQGNKTSINDLCAGLRWLEVATPDFRMLSTDGKRAAGELRDAEGRPQVVRLIFGVDPVTFRPNVVLVSPDRNGPVQIPGSTFIQSTDWFLHGPDGSKAWLPGQFYAYETERAPKGSPTAMRFRDATSADIYVEDGGSMDANLAREDFLPPK